MSIPVANGPPAGLYRLDPVHTFAQFGVKHLVVGRVDGRFNSVEGEFLVVSGDEMFDRIDIRIDPASIDTQVAPRDDDLRSGRFFDVANFPVLTFHSTESKHLAENVWTVTGDLTIRDLTRAVTLEVVLGGVTVDQHARTKIGLSATTKVARADFELTTELLQESGAGGDPDVVIRVDVEAVLEPSRDVT